MLSLAVLFLMSWSYVTPDGNTAKLPQVPILSYHNVPLTTEKPSAYFISEAQFEAQVKYLKENGYSSVLPDDLYNHYTVGKPLPSKPIMFTFDDTRKEHYKAVMPILEKYGYKGAFFIMTVAIGKKNYMTSDEIKIISDRGHCVGHHTYDHQNLKKLPQAEWIKQIDKPREKLEKITGKKIDYLAYPFGLCNEYSVKEIKKRGFKGAFQLSGKQDINEPLLTMRRIIVPGTWSGPRLVKEVLASFK